MSSLSCCFPVDSWTIFYYFEVWNIVEGIDRANDHQLAPFAGLMNEWIDRLRALCFSLLFVVVVFFVLFCCGYEHT